MERPVPVEKEPLPPAKPGKKKWLPILIGAAALVAVLVLVLVILPGGGAKGSDLRESAGAEAAAEEAAKETAVEEGAVLYDRNDPSVESTLRVLTATALSSRRATM